MTLSELIRKLIDLEVDHGSDEVVLDIRGQEADIEEVGAYELRPGVVRIHLEG